MPENEQSRLIRNEIFSIEWDIPNIKDMDVKFAKEKKLQELKEELRIILELGGA